MKYKISIIIPVYKVEKYIEVCCRSLFGMQFEDVEFIFVNDSTPDNSIQIVTKVLAEYPFRANHVKIITHKENRGVACARNSGLDAAVGEYIAFVDADDWIETDMFGKMYRVAEKDNADIVGCNWFLEFEKSKRYIKQPNFNNAKDCFRAMLLGSMRWYLWAFIVRRGIYEQNKIRFLDGADVGEDMAVLIQCFAYADTYRHIDEPLYHYIKSNVASITTMNAKMQIEIVKANVDVVTDFVQSKYPQLINELNFLKLNVKFPLLITDDKTCYDTWNKYFVEANDFIWHNSMQPIRNKILQWAAMHKYYLILKVYNRFVFKFIYGIIFR